MLTGSVANEWPNLSGGSCAGPHIVVDHQHVNGTSFVFSAAVPAHLAVSVSEGINMLRNTPSVHKENVRAIRAVLDRVDVITIPSHAASPIIHIRLRSPAQSSAMTLKAPNPATPAPREPPSFDIAGEERVGRVDHACASSPWAGARRSSAEHPSRCYGGPVSHGV